MLPVYCGHHLQNLSPCVRSSCWGLLLLLVIPAPGVEEENNHALPCQFRCSGRLACQLLILRSCPWQSRLSIAFAFAIWLLHHESPLPVQFAIYALQHPNFEKVPT